MATVMVEAATKPGPGRSRAQDVDRHVGARMRERRIMLGLTQSQLAELIGVTYQQAHKYEKGINVERDLAKALLWFERAAAQEHAEAQFKLGVLYSQAETEFHDPVAAARWTEASARTGYAPAQYNMGVAYLNGAGVPADPVRALAWLELAAASGLEQATALRLRLLDELPEAQIVEGRRLADDIAAELEKRR